MYPSIKISDEEYRERVCKLTDYLQREKLSGVVLFDPHYILYFTGFAFIPTERPMACVINIAGDCGLFVPRLEREHAKEAQERVVDYVEYPSKRHPMEFLRDMLKNMKLDSEIGVDSDGYPWVLGYRGPKLSEITNTPVRQVAAFIEDLMRIKSQAEIDLLRESVRWGNLAHTLLQRYTRVGAGETEVNARSSIEATRAMIDAIGPIYRAQSTYSGAMATYRGQIGRNSAIPHALANNLIFQPGDVLVTGASAPVWGYHSELERTMFIAPVSDSHKQMFEHMLALQDLAFNAIKPGKKCSDIDRTVRKYYEDNGLKDCWRHHVGHAIGLRYHESPFLDIGDDTRIEPGMVLTVEPGLYLQGVGGFRHSDTVVVDEEGIEILTYYPRDLQSLTIV